MKRNPTQDRTAVRHAHAIATHERAEKRLVAAQNRWQKTREILNRYEVKLDKKWGADIGGSYDVRELAKGTKLTGVLARYIAGELP